MTNRSPGRRRTSRQGGKRYAIARETYLADLRAQGFELPEDRISAVRRFRSLDELRTDRRSEVVRFAETSTRHELVPVYLEFEEVPFPERFGWRSLTANERSEILSMRKRTIESSQLDFVLHAEEHGAVVGEPLTLRNRVLVKVPKSAVREILDHPDVVDVFPSWYEFKPFYDMEEIREGTLIGQFHDSAIHGASGGRGWPLIPGGPIRLAIIEAATSASSTYDGTPRLAVPNEINDTHPAWTGRLTYKFKCLFNLPCEAESSTNYATHATAVASIAAGGFGGTRTGMAPLAQIHSYLAEESYDLVRALELAALLGADVANLSGGYEGTPHCDPEFNPWGLNGIIEDVTDLGMLVVAATGNANNDPNKAYPQDLNCNVAHPAVRPEVVAVGGIGNLGTGSNPLLHYDVEELGAYSGRGWITAGRGGSLTGEIDIPAVSITAPGVSEGYAAELNRYQDTSEDVYWSVPNQGTSVSAPVVSAAAGLFREWMDDIGVPWASDARYLKAMILVMGDGTGARSVPPYTTGWVAGASELYGTGKFKAHRLDGLEEPADWTMFGIGLYEGWTLRYQFGALPAGTTQWKWATHIDHHDLTEVPYVLLTIKDACDNDRLIAADWWQALSKYISIQAPVDLVGVCPAVELYGYSVSSSSVPITYNVGYWHGGDPDDH